MAETLNPQDIDQAAGLRRLFRQDSLRVITFAAGSHGVGKTATVANIAAALAEQGKEVLVIDENTGANLATILGAPVRYDLLNVINRDCRLADVLVSVAPGVRILPVARAVNKLGTLDYAQQQALFEAIVGMEHPADVILVDASMDHPLGFSPLGLVASETVIVVAASGSAITDAYALIKKVSLGYSRRDFRILVSKAKCENDARTLHRNVSELARQRGLASIEYAGYVPLDNCMKQALRLSQPVIAIFIESRAAQALRAIAADILAWPELEESGGLEQFVQQLLHFSKSIDPVTIHVG